MAKQETSLKVVKTIKEEYTDDLMQEIVEALLPKVKPIIKPATEKFNQFLAKGKKIVIQSVDGRAMIFIIAEEDIDTFELKEGKTPEQIYDSEVFIEMILSGSFK